MKNKTLKHKINYNIFGGNTEYYDHFVHKKNGNKNVVLWLPGANDTFYHNEHLNNGLYKGCDIFLFHPDDYHPCPGDEKITEKICHTRSDMKYYLSFIDKEISDNNLIRYDNLYLHCHSTGGLLAIEFLLHSKYKNFIKCAVFDDPFFDFNENFIIEEILENIYLLPVTWKFDNFEIPKFNKFAMIAKGTESKTKQSQVKAGYKLPFTFSNSDYAGFIYASAKTQRKLQQTKKPLFDLPCLVLIAEGDSMLSEQDVSEQSDNLTTNLTKVVIKDVFHSVLFPENRKNLSNIISIINSFISNDHKEPSKKIHENDYVVKLVHDKSILDIYRLN